MIILIICKDKNKIKSVFREIHIAEQYFRSRSPPPKKESLHKIKSHTKAKVRSVHWFIVLPLSHHVHCSRLPPAPVSVSTRRKRPAIQTAFKAG